MSDPAQEGTATDGQPAPGAPEATQASFKSSADKPLDRLLEAGEAGDPWAMAYLARLAFLQDLDGVQANKDRYAFNVLKAEMRNRSQQPGFRPADAQALHHRDDFVSLLGDRTKEVQHGLDRRWTQRAADAGNPDGLYLLAVQSYYGDRCQPDVPLGNRLMERARKAGSPEAMRERLISLFSAVSTPARGTEAFDIAERLLENDAPGASGLLATCYALGLGVSPDRDKAIELVELGAKRKCPECAYALALARSSDGWNGIQLRRGSASVATSRAAVLGFPDAIHALHIRYRDANGSSYNAAKVSSTARDLYDSWHPAGPAALASCYEEGTGTRRRIAEAVSLFREGATQGCAISLFNVAAKQIDGVGTERNFEASLQALQSLASGEFYVTPQQRWVVPEAQAYLRRLTSSATSQGSQQSQCRTCLGLGRVAKYGATENGQPPGYARCSACVGTGRTRQYR